MFCWIDSEELDAPELKDLLGTETEPLPSHKQRGRVLLFLPSLANFGLRRGGESPDAEFIAASAEPLRSVWEGMVDIRDVISAMAGEKFSAETWRQAVEQRTALQFVVDWYGTSLADLLPTLRLAELDAEMRQYAQAPGFVRVDVLPPGVPATHWWWRL